MQKKCALCISALYYPEAGNKMPSCRKLECGHAFHFDCLHQMIVSGHHKCPECREPVTKIINMDKSHTILVHLYLAASNFEFYECKKEKIIIGVNMFHLFKLKLN